jgi:uncharacterized protein (DUF4415 family)
MPDGYEKPPIFEDKVPDFMGVATQKGAPMPDGPREPESVTVTLDIDADVLDWLQEQPGWRREIRDLLRFYMETSLIREAGFTESTAPESPEPNLFEGQGTYPTP